jgi:hypothetical protein
MRIAGGGGKGLSERYLLGIWYTGSGFEHFWQMI